MVRPFAPPSFAVNRNCFAEMREATLTHSGEYVYHMPDSAARQAVVVHFQYIPVDAAINPDYALSGTNPKLYALAGHFEVIPQERRGGHSGKAARGSQFEIQGIIYNVKKVSINHRGYMQVELVQDDKCKTARPEFCTEMEALLCSSED